MALVIVARRAHVAELIPVKAVGAVDMVTVEAFGAAVEEVASVAEVVGAGPCWNKAWKVWI